MKFNILSEILHLFLAGIITISSLFLKNIWIEKIDSSFIYLPNQKEGIHIITDNTINELTLINITVAFGILTCGFLISYFDRTLHRKINFRLFLSYFILLFLGLFIITLFNGFAFGNVSDIYSTNPNIDLFPLIFFTPLLFFGGILIFVSFIIFTILLGKSIKTTQF